MIEEMQAMKEHQVGDETSNLPRPLRAARELLLGVIDEAIENRWERAQRVAEFTKVSSPDDSGPPGPPPASVDGSGAAGSPPSGNGAKPADERVRDLTRAFAREMAAVGAVAGGAAAVPGAGTVTFVATTAVELGWFTARASDMILAIAAVHGHTTSTVEDRRAWVLSVLAAGDGANAGATKLAAEVGKGLGKRVVEEIPMEAIRALNHQLGRTIVTKYGTKRGVVALGRALPFGIGAAIGGGANYLFARTIAKRADSFFRLLASTPNS